MEVSKITFEPEGTPIIRRKDVFGYDKLNYPN